MPADLLSTETLSAFVERAQGLYTLPAAAIKVLELTASPQVDARALKGCIEHDPALAARLLRVVNSSLFGLSRQVSDLNQALALLGVKPLKLLVLGFSLPKGLFEGLEADTLAHYWRRTLTKATAAREFGEIASRRGSDEAFLAGLLQDLGQLALVQDLGEPYRAFLSRAQREPGDLATRELAALGFDHAMFSARLLQSWGLPDTLVSAIAQRQEVEHLAALPASSRLLPQTLHLAELAARLLADERPEAMLALHEAGRRYADFRPEQLEAVLASLSEKVELLAEALDLELCQGCDCEQILAQAHAQAQAIAPAALGELEQAAEETRLWQEVEALRRATAAVLHGGAGAAPRSPQYTPAAAPDAGLAAARRTATSSARQTHSVRAATLLAAVGTAVANARQRREAVSLLMVGIANEDRVALAGGAESIRSAVRLIVTAARSLCESEAVCVPVAGAQVAVVLEGCDRSQAVSLARRLVEMVAQCAAARQAWFGSLTLSVGAATLALPPRNFPAHELIDAAARCLSTAHASGGNVVKSIDIY